MSDTFVDPNQPADLSGERDKSLFPDTGPQPTPELAPSNQRPVAPIHARPTQPIQVPQRFLPNYVPPDRSLGKPSWGIDQTMNGQDLTKTIHMPNYDEMFGVIHGAGKQLAGWGPTQLAPQYNVLAMMARALGSTFDYFSGGAFWRNFNSSQARVYEAQRQQYELQREQMYDHGMQTVFAHKQMMDKYDKVFDMIEALGGADLNPDDPELKKAEEVLLRLNSETGHTQFDDLIRAGKIGEVKRMLDTENARLLDMWSGLLTLGNSRTSSGGTVKGDSEFDKSLGAASGSNLPGSAAKGPIATPSPATTEAEYDEYMKRHFRLSNSGAGEARGLIDATPSQDDGFLAKAKGENGKQVIAARNDMRDRIRHAASDQSTSPDDKIRQISAIDPTKGAGIQSLIDYNEDPKSPEGRKNLPLAQLVDKTYKPAAYEGVKKFYSDSSMMREVLRANSLPTAELNLLKSLKPLPENVSIPFRVIAQGETFYIDGDPKYSNLNTAIQDFIVETSAVQAASGVPRVSIVQLLGEHFKSSMSPAQIRGAMQILNRNAGTMIEGMDHRWKSITNKETHMPGYDENAMAIQRGVAAMEPLTGAIPEKIDDGKGGAMDTPRQLLAVGKTPPPPEQRPDYAKKAKAPLNQDQIIFLKEQLKTLPPNDPRRAFIIERLGINP